MLTNREPFMRLTSNYLTFSLLSVVATCLLGCSMKTQPPIGPHIARSGSETFFLENVSGERIPGIHEGMVSWSKWDNGELAFLIWTDIGNGGCGGNGYEGKFLKFDPEFEVKYVFTQEPGTRDGQMLIDGKSRNLADGMLFLVSTRKGRTIVRQLDRDLSTRKGRTIVRQLYRGDLSRTKPEHAAFQAALQAAFEEFVESAEELQLFFQNPDGRSSMD